MRVLSTDFDPRESQYRRKRIEGYSDHVFKTFITPDGQKTLAMMKDQAAGPVCRGSIHDMVAKSAVRDFVDAIIELYERGKPHGMDE